MPRQSRSRTASPAILATAGAAMVVTTLILSACSGGGAGASNGSAGGGTTTSGSGTQNDSTPTPDAEAVFCMGWKSDGGTLATIGEPVLFYPKEESIQEIHISYDIMKKLTPPTAIEADWNTYEAFDAKALAALGKLDSGATLADPALLKEGGTMKPHYTAINAWITSNCR